MDRIVEAFRQQQFIEGTALDQASDLFDLIPLDGTPPQRYVAVFRCTGMVRDATGDIVPANEFAVGVWFPDAYLRSADPFQVVTWLGPHNVYHPNISDRAPFICIGRLVPGTGLVDIIYQCFEIITYNKVTMREDDALNKDACAWARNHQELFPVDRRPLKRGALDFHVEDIRVDDARVPR